MKMEISSYELFKGFPKEFETFLEYTKKLEYDERPDYEMLRKLFDNIMKKENYNYDYIYDWTTLEEKNGRRNIRTKNEPTNNDTLSNYENEINNNNYHIKRNNKIFGNYFENQESPVICSSDCSIF